MLAGRFGGDRAVARIGSMNVVRYGGLLAAAGLLAGLLVHTVAAALVGFVCLGLGLSVLMPLLYSAGGSFPGIPSVQGVAAIATMGFLGLLAGPPLLGSIADAVSLRLALGIVVILCGVMAMLAGALKAAEPTGADTDRHTTSNDFRPEPLPEAVS
jgi:MFS family permease